MDIHVDRCLLWSNGGLLTSKCAGKYWITNRFMHGSFVAGGGGGYFQGSEIFFDGYFGIFMYVDSFPNWSQLNNPLLYIIKY